MLALVAVAIPVGAQTKLESVVRRFGRLGRGVQGAAREIQGGEPRRRARIFILGQLWGYRHEGERGVISNTAPDVALMAAGPLYTGARNDYFIETKLNDADLNKDDIYPGVWDYAKYNGRICAVPYASRPPCSTTTRRFSGKRARPQESPETWTEFLQIAKTAQAKGNVSGTPDFWGFDARRCRLALQDHAVPEREHRHLRKGHKDIARVQR